MAILFIKKPAGPTSHDIVAHIRKITGERRVGHAGTLDPFAEGLLIVMTGPDTKRQSEFMALDKTYEATFALGEERDTDDITGRPVMSQFSNNPQAPISEEQLQESLNKFRGEQMQTPPDYSAKKIKGKKAYELARRGQLQELKPKKVTVYNIELLDYKWPKLKIRTKVSSGTYIRALARDLGRTLKTGAYVATLKRTEIGPYKLKNAQTLEELRVI